MKSDDDKKPPMAATSTTVPAALASTGRHRERKDDIKPTTAAVTARYMKRNGVRSLLPLLGPLCLSFPRRGKTIEVHLGRRVRALKPWQLDPR